MRRRSALPAALTLLAGLVLGVLPAGGLPARADTVAHRLNQAASDLEESTAAVRAAAAALGKVAAELPAAQQAEAAALARLGDANALVAASTEALGAAEQSYLLSQGSVDQAAARLASGRQAADEVGRRVYEQGALGPWRALLGAGDLTSFMERTMLVRVVLRAQNLVLAQVTAEQQQLTDTTALKAAAASGLADAQATARTGAAQAAAGVADARAAAAQVAALVHLRVAALAAAQANRAADLAAYAAAQAASRRLAAQLRALEAARRRAGHGGSVAVHRLLWPTDGPLTSRFGMRKHPIYGDWRFHSGIDIGAPIGQPVVAAAGGTVVFSGAESGYGTLVVIDHGTVGGTDLATAYAHMSALLVRDGEVVRAGQVVGRVGSEGNSTGPHLHFEVRRGGDPVDPLGWVSPP